MDEELELRQKIEKFLAPLAASQGLELLDLDWRREPSGWVLRIYLDHESRPVTLDDCENMSRLTSQRLDEADIIPCRYSLEVSSPGLRRPLKKIRDYQRFLGERAHIELKEPIDNTQQRVVSGFIEAVQENKVLIVAGPRRHLLDIGSVSKAHLDPEIAV
ncbi:MAG: ribosome maturation factor RimP [Elusimicrobia bacterium]|nr:ribosome maturation factor RimP [Elusimicrobiota bacterium]